MDGIEYPTRMRYALFNCVSYCCYSGHYHDAAVVPEACE
jgi:hypothetical protein